MNLALALENCEGVDNVWQQLCKSGCRCTLFFAVKERGNSPAPWPQHVLSYYSLSFRKNQIMSKANYLK
jgi:hypothetical protein